MNRMLRYFGYIFQPTVYIILENFSGDWTNNFTNRLSNFCSKTVFSNRKKILKKLKRLNKNWRKRLIQERQFLRVYSLNNFFYYSLMDRPTLDTRKSYFWEIYKLFLLYILMLFFWAPLKRMKNSYHGFYMVFLIQKSEANTVSRIIGVSTALKIFFVKDYLKP